MELMLLQEHTQIFRIHRTYARLQQRHIGMQLVKQVSASAPVIFNHGSEHPQGEHVEKKMLETPMHEHIGNELKRMEMGGLEVMQPKEIVHVKAEGRLEHHHGKIAQGVYNQQILCYIR